jgi:hypothetical protein
MRPGIRPLALLRLLHPSPIGSIIHLVLPLGPTSSDSARFGPRSSFGARHICQLCEESGHVALRCFKRFNKKFLGAGNDGHFFERQLAMANHVFQEPHGQTPSYVDPIWYVDTSATDHLTRELSRLYTVEPYTS